MTINTTIEKSQVTIPPPAGSTSNPFLYDGTRSELEKFFLLGILVAGKKADVQRKKLDHLWETMRHQDTNMGTVRYMYAGITSQSSEYLPFESLNFRFRDYQGVDYNVGTGYDAFDLSVVSALKLSKTGQYTKLLNAFRYIAQHPGMGKSLQDPATTRQDLMKVPGVGPKTASFFLMYTRRDADVACLDTHILRFMQTRGIAKNVPTATPSNWQMYRRLEVSFLNFCRSIGKPPGVVDFALWQVGSGDPVFYHDGAAPGWYHWDATVTTTTGPFEKREEARHAMKQHINTFLGI